MHVFVIKENQGSKFCNQYKFLVALQILETGAETKGVWKKCSLKLKN